MAGESLKVVAGNATGSSIPLETELVIGRSTPGLGSLGGDSEISRVHARVYHDPSGQLMVEDLGSTNGTFVNGNRISGAQALRGGDQVRVGQTTMTVEGGAAGADGATTVGVSSGASVPEDLVMEVLAHLADRGFGEVTEFTTAEERLTFSLPQELRRDIKAAAALKKSAAVVE